LDVAGASEIAIRGKLEPVCTGQDIIEEH